MGRMPNRPPLVGLVPAAGLGTRMGAGAGSKELVPVPPPDGGGPHRPVCEFILRALAGVGAERAFVVLRAGKWDIPAHFAAADPSGLPPLAFLVTAGTASVPASLDLAYFFVADSTVAMGMADSCFVPNDALARTVARHRAGGAAVTLAAFHSDRPDKTDMVELDGDRAAGFRVKPGPCDLDHTFGAAVWGPEFTEFLHRTLADPEVAARPGELQISQVLGAALEAGLEIDAERSPGGRYIDVGTPDDLERYRRGGIAT
jgi:glucose-1-phosphate thymidylyltransferase